MPLKDKYLHITTEFIAVVFVVPMLIHIGMNQRNWMYRNILIAIAIGTLIVDGYLLLVSDNWNITVIKN